MAIFLTSQNDEWLVDAWLLVVPSGLNYDYANNLQTNRAIQIRIKKKHIEAVISVITTAHIN
jgi:flagellar assembly factor FliW